MVRIIKNNLGNFLVICLIFLTMTIWIFSGKPQIWKKPAFPPEIQEVRAETQTYDTGSGNWNSPVSATVTVECWGGGGGGGGGGGTNKYGGGGGAGGQYAVMEVVVVQGQDYAYSIGAGGTTLAKTDGGTGGETTFGGTTVVAKGGAGGIRHDGGAAGGVGSTTDGVGTTVYAGGNGANGATTYSGGGGGGAGSSGTGDNAVTTTGGSVTAENGGTGGNGVTGNSAAGGAGGNYGGASGGATKNGLSGIGAGGYMVITWEAVAVYSVTINTAPVTYGIVALGATNDTVAEGETQIAENNGTTAAKFNIKGSNSVDWTIITGVPTGENYRHRFATESGTWTALDLNYQTLVASIAQDATQGFDLEILISTGTAIETQQNVNVWIQAIQP